MPRSPLDAPADVRDAPSIIPPSDFDPGARLTVRSAYHGDGVCLWEVVGDHRLDVELEVGRIQMDRTVAESQFFRAWADCSGARRRWRAVGYTRFRP